MSLQHAMEVADESATLYLSGVVHEGDAFALGPVCSELPVNVRTLRIDLHGVAEVNDATMTAIRGVLRYWRESRGGSFRLSLASKHIVATYAEGSFAGAGWTSGEDRLPPATDALPARTAMHL